MAMNLDIKLSRGPILLLLSSTIPFVRIIVIPIIQAVQINFESFITVAVFIIGTYLTATDYAAYIHSKVIILQNQIKNVASSVVLDKTLREIFSLDCNEGALGCALGTYTGIVGLYTLPFSKEQRMRVLQSFLPRNLDAQQVFFTPGGFWNVIVPDSLKIGNFDLKMDIKNYEKISHVFTAGGGNKKKKKELKKQVVPLLNDLSWDNITFAESHDHDTEAETIESDEDEATKNGLPLHIAPSVSTKLSYQSKEDMVVEEVSNERQIPDPVETLQQIAKECICKVLNMTQQKIDDKTLYRISIASSIALFIQLKTSRAARKMVYKSVHFATTCSLIGALCSSVGILKMRDYLLKMLLLKDQNQCLSNRCNDRKEGTFSVLQGMHTLPKPSFLSHLVFEQNHDGHLKRRRLKGIIAAFVLYLFHRRRRRMILHR